VTKSFLRISQNASQGDGGTCYGDSGGPNFLGAGFERDQRDRRDHHHRRHPCRSANVDYRLDTSSARSFLSGYVAVP
jgi:hypothetical protein